MPTTTQNMTVTKGTQKTEVFEFATGDYSKFRFQVNNLDGSVPLLLDGTDENNNWQVEITDLDCTVTIQDSDTLKFDVGTINYMLSCLNSTSGEWEKLFAGNITVSAAGGGSETLTIYNEGRVGRVNVPISEVPAGVNWDIIIDSNGNYYRRNGNTYVSLGSGLNEVTYDELVDLVTGSLLVPEAKYKITDFVEFDGQPERPIIVTAGSTSQLKPDFYFYDEPSIVGRYSIENDQDECPGAITGFVSDLLIPELSINTYSLNLPSIPANSTITLELNIGVRRNKNSLLIQFYSAQFSANSIADFPGNPKNFLAKNSTYSFKEMYKNFFIEPASYSGSANSLSCLLVSRDYRKSKKFVYGDEKYNSEQTFPNIKLTYGDIGIGVLVGYYRYAVEPRGVMYYNKNVQLNACWIEQSDDDTILKIVLQNNSNEIATCSLDSTENPINVAIYE